MDTPNGGGLTPEERSLVPAGAGGGYVPPPPPPPDEEDEEDEGMLRMSFLEHLEEMRSRIIRALMGFGVAFLLCIVFCYPLWDFVRAPSVDALTKIGVKPPNLCVNEPMEAFSIIWVKVPLVFALFLASPWVLYQVWAFIAPGLYQKEKRLAFPFVLSTAGLFILGGAFAYFVAFRFGLAFLLSIGLSNGVIPHRDHHALLRSVRQRDAGRGAGFRIAGCHFLSHAAASGVAALPDGSIRAMRFWRSSLWRRSSRRRRTSST